MALARKVQNYTFKIALGPFTQCLVLYLGGLYLVALIFKQPKTWLGPAQAGFELGAI